jgi:dUTP pyrophosphatase
VLFDEAGMTLPAADRSPAAKVLQELGYGTAQVEPQSESDSVSDNIIDLPLNESPPYPETLSQRVQLTATAVATPLENSLKVTCLSINATLPVRATDGSVGSDVFSAVDLLLQPNTRSAVPLDIAIVPPLGMYAQLKSRSGLSLKHSIDVQTGTIDRDYTGNIQVVLYNTGTSAYKIRIGDHIAQLVLLQVQTPAVVQTSKLKNTNRGDQGFGSTGVSDLEVVAQSEPVDAVHEESVPTIANLTDPIHTMDIQAIPEMANLQKPVQDIEKPYDIYFCTDPFDSMVTIDVPKKDDHPTLGLITEYCDARQRLQVTDMALSTPGSRLKSWRTVIRRSYILKSMISQYRQRLI